MSEWAEFARHRDRIRINASFCRRNGGSGCLCAHICAIGRIGKRGVVIVLPPPDPIAEEWYDSVGLAIKILGKKWDDDFTDEEDAFITAFADEISPRPECEIPCGPCSSAAGEELYHGALGCPRPERER